MDTNSNNEKKPRRPRIGGMIGSEPKDSRFEKVNYGSQEQSDNNGNETSLQQPRPYQPRPYQPRQQRPYQQRYNNNIDENGYQPRYKHEKKHS